MRYYHVEITIKLNVCAHNRNEAVACAYKNMNEGRYDECLKDGRHVEVKCVGEED